MLCTAGAQFLNPTHPIGKYCCLSRKALVCWQQWVATDCLAALEARLGIQGLTARCVFSTHTYVHARLSPSPALGHALGMLTDTCQHTAWFSAVAVQVASAKCGGLWYAAQAQRWRCSHCGPWSCACVFWDRVDFERGFRHRAAEGLIWALCEYGTVLALFMYPRPLF